MTPRTLRLVFLCVIAGALALLVGCDDGGTWLLSMDDEVKLGRDAADEFERTNPISRDAALNRLIGGIGANIAAAARPPNYPYDFRVIESDTVNALAFPGGRIYIYRGLVHELGRDPDMIAWVLGHEATHVSLRHAAKRIEKQVGMAAVTELLLGKGRGADIAGAISGMMFLDYGRAKELQADHQGLIYAHRAGYDPTAAIAVIKVFQAMHGGKDPDKMELLFMTHPGDNTRINHIKAHCKRHGYSGAHYP